MKFTHLLLTLLALQMPLFATAGSKYRVSAESGIYRTYTREKYLLGRLYLNWKYIQNNEKYYLRFGSNLVPEKTNLSGPQSSLKVSTFLNGGTRRARSGFEGSLQTRHYLYHFDESKNIYFNMAVFAMSGYHKFNDLPLMSAKLEYLYRDQSMHPASQLDALRLTAGPHFGYRRGWVMQPMLTLESFRVYAPQITAKNSGWRGGLDIRLQHRGPLHLSAAAQLLAHQSDLIGRMGREWHIQLVAGTFLKPRWSLFLYADYRDSRINNKNGPVELRYTTFSNENWLYLKLEYDHTSRQSLYLRGGYFRDTFPDAQNDISGTQLLVGFSWKTP